MSGFPTLLPVPPAVYQGWVEFGVMGLTDRLMAERLEVYLNSLLRRN